MLNKATVRELREELELEMKVKLRAERACLIERYKRDKRRLAEEKAQAVEQPEYGAKLAEEAQSAKQAEYEALAEKLFDGEWHSFGNGVEAREEEPATLKTPEAEQDEIPYAEPVTPIDAASEEEIRVGNFIDEVVRRTRMKKGIDILDLSDEELVDFAIEYMNTRTRARKKRTGDLTEPGYRRAQRYSTEILPEEEQDAFRSLCATGVLKDNEEAQRTYLGRNLAEKLREFREDWVYSEVPAGDAGKPLL